MSRMAVVECYQLYMSLKLHFESKSYDYFKYNGKTKLQPFDKRKDKYQFQKLCRMVEEHDMVDFLVANFAFRDKVWVGDLISDDATDMFLKYRKYIETFPYQFNLDLDKLFEDVYDDHNVIFKVEQKQYPIIINKLMGGDISILTFVIMDDILGFGENISKKIDDDILWPKVYTVIKKLKPFLKYDKLQAKNLILAKIQHAG